MKYGSIKTVCLVVLACVAVLSAFGDETTVNWTSIIMGHFNGETEHSWHDGRRVRNYDFTWETTASKFATKTADEEGNDVQFPLTTYVASWPVALFGYRQPEGEELKSFGIQGRFDRRGYNWIDVYPIATGSADNEEGPEAFEIPIPGRLQSLDLWVWGSNLRYYMEVYFRDYQGVVHTLQLGELGYQGWRNLRVRIPTSIPQSKRILPKLAGLTFVNFRIWTTPMERVDNFYVYFNQMKVLTDIFESLFDGDELADPERVQEPWAQN